MRCQDCGQQFTRWEAFKVHLRKHVEEEAEMERLSKRRAAEPSSRDCGEGMGPDQKRQKANEFGDGDECREEEEHRQEDYGDDDDDDEEFFDSTCQIKPSEIFKVRPRVAMLSEEEKPVYGSAHRVYACSICGKVYSYLESFRNHQKMHASTRNSQVTPELSCKECGKVFGRAGSLAVHMKVHKLPVLETPNLTCDQCNKSFNSIQTWIVHKDIHKQKPFWCLSCAKGFRDSEALDKHLLGHDLKRHKCDICDKTFRVPAELRYHYNTHTGAKPYSCSLCHKNFSQLGNLITHRKKHLGVYKDGGHVPLGNRASQYAGRRRVTVMKKLIVGGMGTMETLQDFMDEQPGEDGGMAWPGLQMGGYGGVDHYGGGGGGGGGGNNDDNSSSSDSSDSSGSDESESSSSDSSAEEGAGGAAAEQEEEEEEEEEEEPAEEQVQEQAAEQAAAGEWECFECGSHFTQEPELHLHYMKHASGEL